MNKKNIYKYALVVVLICLLCVAVAVFKYYLKDTIKNNIKVENDIKEEEININISVGTKTDGESIILDENGMDNIILNVNREYTLNIYNVNYDETEDKLKKSDLVKSLKAPKTVKQNIKTTLSETIPNICIEVVTKKDGTFEYIPSYNGKTGGYDFIK